MSPAEKKLLLVFKKLAPAEQDNLQAYGEFLLARQHEKSPQPIPEPQHIPRGENESIVAALKRLSASYSMLDKPQLLNDSSVLMTQHVMQGRAVDEVIDDLEALFARFYQELLDEQAALSESSTQEKS
ncbi:MAG: Crp/Fnr family transcriptional regulator [Gammaproteobacteria bacterium]|nr:Crp/Fnr family transcriptional regulator [Gammaproteobacteria bacterium]MCF6261753.1 Crp/Fnr family transcriptional regulator [Gammaproteobacteria bacterium]